MTRIKQTSMQNISPTPTLIHEKSRRRGSHLLTILLSLLALLALAHFIAVNHDIYTENIANTNITHSTISCASLVHTTDYTKLVSIQEKSQEMAAVQFIDGVVGGEPAALIQVLDRGPQEKVDVYVYGCTPHQQPPTLNLLFKQQGLIKGSVDITQTHTLSIGQLDTTLPTDSDTLLQPLQQNVFQEYSWTDGALNQIQFPGLYPVTSRSEAEALQDEANNGQALPWSDPVSTAQQMAEDLFQWPRNTIATTLKKNKATEAQVLLTKKDTHIAVSVTLTRLIQPDKRGLWWVTSAQTPGISLDQSQFNSPLSSPLLLQGLITPTTDKVAATLFNHTLTAIHTSNDATLQTDDSGHFSGTLSYANIFPDQPGLLLITEYPKDAKNDAYLLLTNLILD